MREGKHGNRSLKNGGVENSRERIRELLQSITQFKKLCVEEIRQYCKLQKGLWQRVPTLALEADGRGGFLDRYQTAYRRGYWPIDSCELDGYYRVYIDLATGELIDALTTREERPELADDSSLHPLMYNIDEINAVQIIKGLTNRIQKPNGTVLVSVEEVKKRRDKLKRELNLEELYTRKSNK